jgi:ATPase subunit of ABC transporter with duplicated ATPase domains
MIEKLDIEEIKPSSRRYPAIIFEQERQAGDQILNIENLSANLDEEVLFKNVNLNLSKGDKVIIYSKDTRAVSVFL